jgi:hypothetical protein
MWGVYVSHNWKEEDNGSLYKVNFNFQCDAATRVAASGIER